MGSNLRYRGPRRVRERGRKEKIHKEIEVERERDSQGEMGIEY